MNARHLRRAGAIGAVVALGAAGLASTGATADSKVPAVKKAATITMVADGHNLGYEGDRSVDAGAKLTIVDATNPKKVGPHTFTLIKKGAMPESKAEMKECEELGGVCGKIAEAHEVNMETFEIGAPIVDAGEKGWDTSFGKTGDTFYDEKKGSTNSRKVTAEAGTTLHYFCVIHPFMQGKIKVK